MRRLPYAAVFAAVASGAGFPAQAAPETECAAARQPNIVLIVADDLGVGDLGCYAGTGVSWTPNIDRLATQGVRALNAHATAAVCTPSRYAMMTGRYYAQNWQGELLVDTTQPTIASVLRDRGYATGYFGKWHLGWGLPYNSRRHRQDIDWNGELPAGVLECGFDTYFGTPFSHNEPPFVFVENRRVVGLDSADLLVLDVPERLDPDHIKKGFGVSRGARSAHAARPVDRIDLIVTDRVVDFIRKHADRPFFANLNLVAPHVPIAPAKEFRGKTGAGDYGDFVLQMDACVGRVLDALDQFGLTDNTLVVLTSDNGAVIHRETLAIGHRSNFDLLGQKTDVWEGGVRVPFIARWPGRIPSGETTRALIALSDLGRTFWTAAGADLPLPVAPESLNQLTVLLHPASLGERKEMMYLGTHPAYFAIRSGDWVYLPGQGSFGHTTDPSSPWLDLAKQGGRNSDYDAQGRLRPNAPKEQLYDLRADPQQTTNIIREHPDVAVAMAKRLRQFMSELQEESQAR